MSSFETLMQLLSSFENYLGDNNQPDSPYPFEQSLIEDEQETLPWSEIKRIQAWGYMDYLIPREVGGRMDSLVEPYLLTRSLARRDLTLAIALGLSFFAALPLWIAGSVKQKKRVALLMQQGQIGAFALTEEAHGSDLSANALRATPCSGGWVLSGQKWCVNFASAGESITTLCRTNEKGGLLGFSLFFFEKALLGKGFKNTAKLPTHGVRGLDISGFVLDQVIIPEEGLIGRVQQGLEITYKTLQMSRTMLVCLATGAADSALRLALSFSLQRVLYGKHAFDIPVVKQRLGELFTRLLIADCTGFVMGRACTLMPEQMSLWSAISKFLVPQIAEEVVEESALILGARAYLRTTPWARFQKIRRDIQVVGLFDGSSQVNLSLIAGSLLPQAKKRGTCSVDKLDKLCFLFNVSQACPAFSGEGLGLFAHGEDPVMAGLAHLNADRIQPLINLVREAQAKLDEDIFQLQEKANCDPRSLAAFRLAEQYCWLFSASCCLHFWVLNQDLLCDELKNEDWISLAIYFILNKIRTNQSIDSGLYDRMAARLEIFYQQNRLFSVLPTRVLGA